MGLFDNLITYSPESKLAKLKYEDLLRARDKEKEDEVRLLEARRAAPKLLDSTPMITPDVSAAYPSFATQGSQGYMQYQRPDGGEEVFSPRQFQRLQRTANGGDLATWQAQQAAAAEMAKPRDVAPGHQIMSGNNVLASAPFEPKAPNLPEGMGPDGQPMPGYLEFARKKAEATRGPESAAKETWNQPIAEVDKETGKPIQVQYSNLGNRRVVADATPAKQGNAFDRQDYWRGQFKPLIDSAQNTMTQSDKVRSSLRLDSGVGHIAAINALQKQIDEGAVVRDQDVALVQSAQSFLSKYEGEISRLKEGKLLTPKIQQEMQGVSDALSEAILAGVEDRTGAYRDTMKAEGVDFNSVLPRGIQEKINRSKGGANKPGAVAPAPPAAQRVAGTVYQTPKGPLKWTGTGWLPAGR